MSLGYRRRRAAFLGFALNGSFAAAKTRRPINKLKTLLRKSQVRELAGADKKAGADHVSISKQCNRCHFSLPIPNAPPHTIRLHVLPKSTKKDPTTKHNHIYPEVESQEFPIYSNKVLSHSNHHC